MFRHDDEAAQYEALSAYRDGRLTPQEEEEIRGHLAQCPACRGILEDMERIAALLQIPEAEVPDGLSERWKAAVRKEKRARQRKRWIRPAGTLAAALMLAAAGIGLLPQLTKNDAQEPQSALIDAAAEAVPGEEAQDQGTFAFRAAFPPAEEAPQSQSDPEQAEEKPEETPAEAPEAAVTAMPQIAAFSLEAEDAGPETEQDALDAGQSEKTDEARCTVRVLAPEEGKIQQVYNVIEGYALARGAVFRYEEAEGVRELVCMLSREEWEDLFAALENIGCAVGASGLDQEEATLFFRVEQPGQQN